MCSATRIQNAEPSTDATVQEHGITTAECTKYTSHFRSSQAKGNEGERPPHAIEASDCH